MKLLILTQKVDKSDPVLGFAHGWVEEFAKHCETLHVICLYEGAHTLPHNVHVHSLGKEKGVSRLKYLWRFYKYIWSLRHEYDAVFAHMNPEYVVLGGIPWRLLRKRIGLWYTHKNVDAKLRIATLLTHKSFSGSRNSYQIDTPKLTVTGQGVDPSLFSYKEHINLKAPTMVSVSRISPVKNVELAIDTLRCVRERGVDARLLIVGAPATDTDKVYETDIKQMVEKSGLGSHISWLGGKDATGVRDALRAADIFLHTSLTHSADKTLPEAMSTGLLVVTSNKAYQQDVPEVCFAEPNASAYTDAIIECASYDDEKLSRMRTRMRERVLTHHSLGRLVGNIIGILSSR